MPNIKQKQLLDIIIESYLDEPIDLLNTNNGAGEYTYIINAYKSYMRTLRDISSLLVPGRNILEIGSYLGVVSLALAKQGYLVTAADIPEYQKNPRLLDKYNRAGVGSIALNLNSYSIAVPDASFDAIIMCETLEHLNFNPLPVLKEINRILKPGGYLYIALPNLASLVNRVKLLLGCSIHNPVSDFVAQLSENDNMLVGIHWREYTRNELLELLLISGFSVQRHYYFTSTASCLPARLLYTIFPNLRPNQTAVALKRFI